MCQSSDWPTAQTIDRMRVTKGQRTTSVTELTCVTQSVKKAEATTFNGITFGGWRNTKNLNLARLPFPLRNRAYQLCWGLILESRNGIVLTKKKHGAKGPVLFSIPTAAKKAAD